MFDNASYVMRDQVRNNVASIMKYDVTRNINQSNPGSYLLVAVGVIFLYLLAMAVAS